MSTSAPHSDASYDHLSTNALALAFRSAPFPIHVWRGVDDPILLTCNRIAEQSGIAAKLGERAVELLAGHRDALESLQRCFREEHSVETGPVSYLTGSSLVALRHEFAAPDTVLTFVHEVDALRSTEQKYRTLLESINVVVWQADPETFRLVYVSKTIERFGYTVEQAMQPGFWVSWLHPDDRPWAVNLCQQELAAGRDHSFEYRAVGPDGTVRWVRDVIAVRKTDGRTELYGVFIDITDTREKDEHRRFEHLLLGVSFESTRSGMAVVGPDGSLAFHNTSLRTMLGVGDESSHLADHPLLHVDAPINGNKQSEVRLPNGRIAARIVTPLAGPDGESFGHLVVLRDVTEERRREDELREREEYFRSLIEHSTDVICMIETNATILYKSPSIFAALGYTPEELIGTNMYDEIVPEDWSLAREAIDHLIRTGAPQQVVLRARHKNQSTRWFSVVYSKLETKHGLRIIANARDITERKMLETSLEQAHRTASLGHLAATMAHEMNNVLMSIQPNVEVLARLIPDDTRIRRVVRTVEQAVRRGKRTTQEILRFTRPAEPRLQPLDVERWLTELIGEVSSMLGPSIDLQLHLPDIPLRIQGDSAGLHQVLTNILINARDAMNGAGRIEITVSDGESSATLNDFVRISIRDHGPGMPRNIADRIFEPMFTTKPQGIGLGLAVVQQIISAHRGHVNVESAEGHGTTFHIFLPRTQSAEAPVARVSVSIPEGLRVLIAEDERVIGSALRMLLSMEGAEVQVVERGRDVVPAIEHFQPAIVILDVGLPDSSGTEVYAWIRERWPALPVIFSTGHADEGRLSPLLEPPLADVALKPYETSELLAKIHRAVELDETKTAG